MVNHSHSPSLHCLAVRLTLTSFHEPHVQFLQIENLFPTQRYFWFRSLIPALSSCWAAYHSSYPTLYTL